MPQNPPLSQSSRSHHSPWGPGGGTPGGTAPGWGAPAGGCCCGPTVDPACPSCSEGPKLPGGAPLPAGAGATEAGAMAKPWTVGGPAAPGGGIGWEPGGRAGGGCCCCWCICWKCCCRARISAYFSCSMWKACLSAKSCCLWYSSCRGQRSRLNLVAALVHFQLQSFEFVITFIWKLTTHPQVPLVKSCSFPPSKLKKNSQFLGSPPRSSH